MTMGAGAALMEELVVDKRDGIYKEPGTIHFDRR